MCGIFGMMRSETFGKKPDEFMKECLLVGRLRGEDGVGLLTVNPRFSYDHYALAGTVENFFEDAKAKKVLDSVGFAVAAVGHHRASTRGKDVSEHCHPFNFGDVVGVHNGSLPFRVLDTIDPKGDHPVDSARVYAALATADDPITVLRELNEGAYALVWYNSKTRCIYMARNRERPLHVLETDTAVLFASELGMLSWISGRVGLHSEGDKLSQLDVDTLYTFPLDDLASVSARAYTHTPVPYVPPYYSGAANYQNPQKGWWDHDVYDSEYYERPAYTPPDTRGPTPRVRQMLMSSLPFIEQAYPGLDGQLNSLRDCMHSMPDGSGAAIQVIPIEETQNALGIWGIACLLVEWGSAVILYDSYAWIPRTSALSKEIGEGLINKALTPHTTFKVYTAQPVSYSATVTGHLIPNLRILGPRAELPELYKLDAKLMKAAVATVQGSLDGKPATWGTKWDRLMAAA